jgi:hypothetical protein
MASPTPDVPASVVLITVVTVDAIVVVALGVCVAIRVVRRRRGELENPLVTRSFLTPENQDLRHFI